MTMTGTPSHAVARRLRLLTRHTRTVAAAMAGLARIVGDAVAGAREVLADAALPEPRPTAARPRAVGVVRQALLESAVHDGGPTHPAAPGEQHPAGVVCGAVATVDRQ
jgi:hypothetical protein